MALFDRLKKMIAPGQRRSDEEGIAAPHKAAESNASSSFADRSRITKEEKHIRISQLTPREYELYLLLLEGFTLKESAKQLSVKYSTANTHMTGIYKKLGVKSRAELIINYRNINGEGLLDL
jgi:DNA-binding CsgD family transcriptional regulator